MGVCVVLNADGTVTATADTLETCSAHWLASASEVQSGAGLLPPLSVSDGLLLGSTVWGVLALSWAWRFIRKSI